MRDVMFELVTDIFDGAIRYLKGPPDSVTTALSKIYTKKFQPVEKVINLVIETLTMKMLIITSLKT